MAAPRRDEGRSWIWRTSQTYRRGIIVNGKRALRGAWEKRRWDVEVYMSLASRMSWVSNAIYTSPPRSSNRMHAMQH